MNTISKTHQRLSERLENPRVLENPEEFLGENYEAVLNFWLIFEELSEEQLRVVKERYQAFRDESHLVRSRVVNLAWEASKEVVGQNYALEASQAARDITNTYASCWTTHELIGMHKILEVHQQSLTIFNMFLEEL